jgi:sugar/nucleoside kinase (ribokinase family)
VGADALGDLARTLLAAEGLDAGGLETDPAAATSYSIVVEAPGHDRSFWHHAGANDAYTGADLDLSGAEAVHVGYPSLLAAMRAGDGQRLVDLFARARDAGIRTSLDLAVVDPGSPAAATGWGDLLARVLPLTDVVSPSADDLRSIAASADPDWRTAGPAELAASLVALGAGVALVSDGAGGVDVAAAAPGGNGGAVGVRVHRDAPRVAVVSTNGAGDATSAGFLAAVLRGAGPAEAADAAVAAGAAAVSRGPSPTIPWKAS